MSQGRLAHASTIVIVDDHPMLLRGTQACLNSVENLLVIGTAPNGTAAMALIQNLKPDIVLLDIRLPDVTGLDLAKQILKVHPAAKIILITGQGVTYHPKTLSDIGIRGFLEKSASDEDLITAVTPVAAGETFWGSSQEAALANAVGESTTRRERDVLQLLHRGLRNVQIAEQLAISTKTVEFHIANLMQKLDAGSRTALIFQARKHGLILDLSDDGQTGEHGS